jgi:hypothetical protein
MPPRLATWILAQIAPDYRRDSFLGDLIEQYEQGRPAYWYWRQVGAVMGLVSARLLRKAFSQSAAAWVLRLAAESLAVTGLLAFAYEGRRVGAPANFLQPLAIAAVALLCLVVSLLCVPSSTAVAYSGKPSILKKLLAAFAAIMLSAATLTWAGTATGAVAQAAHAVTCPKSR